MTTRNRITLSDSWEYFPVTLNEALASIRVDLLAKSTLPTAIHTHYLRLPFRASDNGMPIPEDLERLSALEDAIEAHLLQVEDVYHIGTIISQGVMDLFYVSEHMLAWNELCFKVLGESSHVASSFENDHYALYDTSLYPSVYDFNTIQNRNLCMQLEQSGTSLELIRPIDFYFTFKTEQNAQNFAQTLNPKFEIVNADISDAQEYVLQLNLELPPTFANMNTITAQLLKASLSEDGVFDGWGVTPPKETN